MLNKWRIITIIHLVILTGLSLIPGPAEDSGAESTVVPSWHEEVIFSLGHIPMYALFVYFLFRSLPAWNRKIGGKVFWFAFGYGLLMEILQFFVPHRTPALLDVCFNAIGVTLAFFWVNTKARLTAKKS